MSVLDKTDEQNQLEKGEKDLQPDSGNLSKDESTAVEPEFLRGNSLILLVFSISLAGFLYSLDVSIIVTAIPMITTHFHTIQDIGWYGSAYLITLCACAPTTGKIYQFNNSKITFFTFIVIFEIGSLICGVAPSSSALVIGRAVAGIGGSGIFTGGLAMVGSSVPKDKRAQMVALVYVFSMLGSVVAPMLGGVLTQRASWRWCFYLNLPAGAVTLIVLTFLRIPQSWEKTEKRPSLLQVINRLDPFGFALFAPTCIMILLALQWGGSTYAWNSSIIIGLFIGCAASLTVFLVWENRRGDTAMVPLSILRQRVVYSSCLVVMVQFGSMQIFNYYLPVWFQTILGVGPIQSGAYFMATAGPLIISTLVTGVLANKVGSPTIFTLVGNAISSIGSGLMTTLTPSSATGVWVGYQILAGFGRGMTLQQPVNAVQSTLEPSQMSVGTSMVVFCQFFGGALFLALAETDFSSSLRSALNQYAPGVDATFISNIGASGVRSAVTSDQLPMVLMAYNQAVRNTFYLGCAASAVAFLAAWGMGLKRVKKSNDPAAPAKV